MQLQLKQINQLKNQIQQEKNQQLQKQFQQKEIENQNDFIESNKYNYPILSMSIEEYKTIGIKYYDKSSNINKIIRSVSKIIYTCIKRLYTDQLRFKIEEEENDELIVQEKLKDQSSILTKEFLENNFKQSLDFKYVDKYFGRKHRVVLCMPNKIALIKDKNEIDEEDQEQLRLIGIEPDDIEFEVEKIVRSYFIGDERWYDFYFKNCSQMAKAKSCDLNDGPMKEATRMDKNPRTNRKKKPFYETSKGKKIEALRVKSLATNNDTEDYSFVSGDELMD